MFSNQEFAVRRENLCAAFPVAGIDALLVTHLPNIRYLTGFKGSNGILAHLFTDPRYTLQAGRETECVVHTVRGPLLPKVSEALKRRRLKRIGFEKDRILFETHRLLCEKLGLAAELVPATNLVEDLRMVKSGNEIELIRKAVNTNSAALAAALKRFRAGMTEAALAAEIEYRMRILGAECASFETIVASGANAALPHYRPANQPIQPDRLLLIDMGATLSGYSSDMTRTVSAGDPGRFWKRTYNAVLEAQLAAIDSVRPGVRAAKPDQVARQVLAKSGLEKHFTHAIGHGLGLEIHESPRLGKKVKTTLQEGMVITIEPGVYLEGKGGIRIEDMVLVTRNGCEVLTPTTKELTSI
ncbi:MAG: aminopeptidase P family protein [Candidatus Solibacter usitatus]|nr:aminopeptidase P family protein [Candidatus Solibacter usitatus]